jgi:hypothetical protein
MKKVLVFLASVAAVVVFAPAAAFAAPAQTIVTGTVTNNGHPVNNAKVTVVCNNHSRTNKTGANGGYSVSFPKKQCPDGTKVTVVAAKNKMGGVSNGTAAALTTQLNVAIVNVALPEFGIITGVGAMLAGAGMFMVMRRKHTVEQQ